MVNGLFDINSLFPNGPYKGLFFDSQLNLWTNKNGRDRRLANQYSLPVKGDYLYTLDDLREIVLRTAAFKIFLNNVDKASKKNTIYGKFIIAFINEDDDPQFSILNPQVFDTREEAEQKMISYKTINPNSRWCLFRCEGELKSINVVLE